MSITPYFSEIPSAATAAILVTSFLHTRRRRIQILTIQKMTQRHSSMGMDSPERTKHQRDAKM